MKYIKYLVLLLLITGCVSNTVDKTVNTNVSAYNRTVDAIISGVELAYTTAYMNNIGSLPTLKQVASNFKMKSVVMEQDGKIITKDDYITCNTLTENNKLKVECTTKDNYSVSTTSEMELSNN